jgi:hypothetical protein
MDLKESVLPAPTNDNQVREKNSFMMLYFLSKIIEGMIKIKDRKKADYVL